MPLTAGARVGSYEILAAIGAGGMGQVYRARDTKLNRDVALKILPEAFIADPDRRARFTREAQVLASLNHPNIAHIHGLEDAGPTLALVMELVDGSTLAEVIQTRRGLPLDEVLPIARQIADALETAHERGIVHRDLKPANIKVRTDGAVKVLDFGLAKAFDPVSSTGDVTTSPTLSIHATQAGIILGTPAYMAPEQARGLSVDRRADIWAFGCVLYEMLTGRRPFDGDDVSIALAAVLKTDPDWQVLPPATPAGLRRLLTRCLKKDPKDRLQAIGDARVELDELLAGGLEPAPAPLAGAKGWRRVAIPVATGLAMSLATAAIVWFAVRSTIAPPQVSRLSVAVPSSAALTISETNRTVAITPDGSQLIYVGASGTTLFVRRLDQLEATPLVRGVGPAHPFVSPDGQWVGFFDGPLMLKKVAITGGPAVLIARLDSIEQGATWLPDGTIVFATTGTATPGLQRVNANGGEPAVLTRPDRARGEANHVWPEMLPGGQAVLFTVTAATGGLDAASIAVLELRTGRLTTVVQGGTHAQYVSSGHLVFGAGRTLRAVRFDLTHLKVVGAATPVVPQVVTMRTGAVEAAMARDGTLVYVSGGAVSGSAQTLVWVDRQGRETPIAAPPGAYTNPRVSPDGARIAVAEKLDIWFWDVARTTLTPVTFGPSGKLFPVWTPDGRRIVFTSDRAGPPNLFSQAADGTGAVERLTESPNPQMATAVSPDGTQVVFSELSGRTGEDVMALRLNGTSQVLPLVQTPFTERNGTISPDGRWLAYEANDSESFQIYVRPFPEVNRGRWQVSTNGGTQPSWARSGQELFYLAPDGALMRVAVTGGHAWTAGAPTKILEGRYVVSRGGSYVARNYDIAADGQRFLMVKESGGNTGTPPQILVVQHFDEELKRLVPAK